MINNMSARGAMPAGRQGSASGGNILNKKIIIALIALVLIIGGVVALRLLGGEDGWICQNGEWVKYGNPKADKPSASCGEVKENIYEGEIAEIFGNNIVLRENSMDTLNVAISQETKIISLGNKPLALDYLHKGFRIKIIGVSDNKNNITSREIKILEEPNIIVFEPRTGDEVGLPLVIKGEARVFENTFSYRIKDGDGTLLYENNSMTSAPDAGVYGAFEISANYPKPKGDRGTVEVFERSAKDGSEINKVVISVIFKNVESTDLKVYFSNNEKNPGMINCEKVVAVERRVLKTEAPARAAIEELLKGPDAIEAKDGYFTNINPGVIINNISLENGVAKVDFNKKLDEAVGGSCRVTAIRSQITGTLKQFSTIKDVVISIDGRSEGILQP